MKADVISNQELKNKLEQSPAPRVTKEQIEARIVDTTFHRIGETVTVANVVLDNGFSVRGESACVNPENYDPAIGERIAYDNAFNQLWPLFGFMLAEINHQGKQLVAPVDTAVGETLEDVSQAAA